MSPPPILLINALGQGPQPWARLRAHLAGHPTTLWHPDLALSWPEQVDVLVQRLRAHERPPHVVGWCTGPKTALRAAARQRHLMASLVLLNPSFKAPGRPPSVDTAYERELAELLHAVHDQPRMAARLVTVLCAQRAAGNGSQAGVPDELRDASALPFQDAPSLLAYAAQHLGFWADDPLADADVRRLSLPLTVITATGDTAVAAADVGAVVDRFAQTRVEAVDAGHFALYTHATEVARLIEAHIAAYSQGSRPVPRQRSMPSRTPGASSASASAAPAAARAPDGNGS